MWGVSCRMNMGKCLLRPIVLLTTPSVGFQWFSRAHVSDRALIPRTAPEAL